MQRLEIRKRGSAIRTRESAVLTGESVVRTGGSAVCTEVLVVIIGGQQLIIYKESEIGDEK